MVNLAEHTTGLIPVVSNAGAVTSSLEKQDDHKKYNLTPNDFEEGGTHVSQLTGTTLPISNVSKCLQK
jgi:hypothetical protein